MDIGNLVIQILKVIAWPLSVIIIVLILRPYLGQAILAIARLKYKDLEVEFRKNLEEAEHKAEELKLPAPEQARTIPESITQFSPYDRLLEIATISPRAAVVEAWLIVELSIREIAKAQGTDIRSYGQEMEMIKSLIRKGRLPAETFDLIKDFRRMRNNAAHAHEFEISTDTAIQYVALALRLASSLQAFLNE